VAKQFAGFTRPSGGWYILEDVDLTDLTRGSGARLTEYDGTSGALALPRRIGACACASWKVESALGEPNSEESSLAPRRTEVP